MLLFSYAKSISWPVSWLAGLPVKKPTGERTNKLTRKRFILPACLGYAGNFAVEREISKTNTADAEPAQVRAAAATLHAAIILPHGEFRRPLLFFTQSFSCHTRSFISS
jgi:hypothetical protein